MKPHYPILDGLRGTAAIMVIIFHLFEARFPVLAENPVHHGFLAVDFFFMLSGFVVGYAYDDRWERMSILEFLKIRFIRLHPLVIISVLLGGICFWLDPYTESAQNFSLLKLIGITLLGLTLLPTPDVRGWGETHSLDGPLWSLLQEYIANILYAVFGKRISKIVLWIIVIISGIVLTTIALVRGDIGSGWGFDNFGIGLARMMFPFFAGLLLFRSGKLIRIPGAYIICSIILIIIFLTPMFSFNGIFEAVCILVIFPIIVAAGAGGKVDGKWEKLCKFSGEISYPIYIIHYPFIYLLFSWIAVKKPTPTEIVYVAIGLFIFFVALAYAILKLYDQPVRAWLKKKLL